MKTARNLVLLLSLLFITASVTGCATNRQQQVGTTAYRGPIQEPKPDTSWWEALGFVTVPAASYFSSR